jgi:pimeloyl-ACP methyl ester carboxylesterase
VLGANSNDYLWRNGLSAQVSEFFTDRGVRESFLPVFVHQALEIRSAFFGLTHFWTAEVAKRGERIAELRVLPVPAKVIFGADDPYLNSGLAQEFHQLIPGSELQIVKSAGQHVQLDQPAEVARRILDE